MRLDETSRDKRRDETRQDTRNQETRRDKRWHFRNRIFRPSERRRITLRKQYTLDPTLSWTLRITFSGGQNALQADNEASYHVVDDFRPGITTSHCSTLRRHENVILQGLWDPRIKAILHHWLTEILHSMVIDFIVERLLPDCLITLKNHIFKLPRSGWHKANYPRVEDLTTRCQKWRKFAHRKPYNLV